jgi:hypothetical protein
MKLVTTQTSDIQEGLEQASVGRSVYQTAGLWTD